MKEIEMPALSPTMESGKIVRWVKKEGEEIKRGDIIAEIETDKAAMDFESEEEGRLGKIIRGEGEEVKVGETIGLLLEIGDKEDKIKEYKVVDSNNVSDKNKVEKKTENKKENISTDKPLNNNNNSGNKPNSNRKFISPLAKVLAAQNNIDISILQGTGPGGRIVKEDIMSYIKEGVPVYKTDTPSSNQNVFKSFASELAYKDILNSSMRKTIAKRLLESKVTIPHYYLNLDCNVDELLKARVAINSKGKDKYKISINDFIIKAVALAMRDVPEANSYWQCEVTRQFSSQDIAVAVAIPNGLITPIIKDAGNKGLIAISNEMKELAKKAKEGKLKPEEYQGGGFSISNLGMFGIDSFAAIINPPQSGILAVGAVKQKPIVVNNNIVVGNILSLVLSLDHRVLDGALGGTFMVKIKDYLENPSSMLL